MGPKPTCEGCPNLAQCPQMPRKKAKSKGRKGRRTTRAAYEKMVDAHRVDLGNHTAAAKVSGVSYNTALKAFKEGLGKDKPAIRTLISREMLEARAALAKYKETDADTRAVTIAAAKDMADARAMQARSLRMSRNNAVASMGMGANLLRAGLMLSGRVETLISDEEWTPTPQEAVSLLRGITDINRQAVEMAAISDQMEARILGQPDIVVGHVDMTPDQAVVTLAEGARTLERLRRRAARGDLPPGINPAVIIDVEASPLPSPSLSPAPSPPATP